MGISDGLFSWPLVFAYEDTKWYQTPFLKLTLSSPKDKQMSPESTQGKFLTSELANPHAKQKKTKSQQTIEPNFQGKS